MLDEGRTDLLLVLAFGAIAAVMVLAQVVAYFQWNEVQASVSLIEENALASIKLVQRMGIDVERQRVLIDRHIFEADAAAMEPVEQQLVAVQSDYEAAARAYDPLTTFPGEDAVWRLLRGAVADTDSEVSATLALSRQNQDLLAKQKMVALEPQFAAIERDVDALVEINQVGADQATAKVRALLQSLLRFWLAAAAITSALLLVTGAWTAKVILRREQQVRRYAAQLENRNRELDAFAGRVAHDLRGPLGTVTLSASLLSKRLPKEESLAAVLGRGLQQMDNIIGDLLTLSRIDSQVHGAVAQIAGVAANVAEDLHDRLRESGGVLQMSLEPARVSCGEGLLRQALFNLLENAVKYRRLDVPLHVTLAGHAAVGRYEFRVADNGAGMTSDEASQVFEPFFRGEDARTLPGTGLGLSIVKRIVEASGGTVAVTSRVGYGSTFVIGLPLAVPADEVAAS
jgi:signal transduction histidine kinase